MRSAAAPAASTISISGTEAVSKQEPRPASSDKHLGRRVRLHGVEYARVRQRFGEAEVVLADDIEVDDEARPVVLTITQKIADARGHWRSPHQVQ